MKIILYILLFSLIAFSAFSQRIERFEHLDSGDGLSQNSVLSAFCDDKGFLWFGTMNGLNRYDGYRFRIFKTEDGNENSLTNNRIDKIWQDDNKILWVQTYDSYIHYFIPETEEFITIPNKIIGKDNTNSITFFRQYNKDETWVGTSHYGALNLRYNATSKRYELRKAYNTQARNLSNDHVNFIFRDLNNNLWIGTDGGINQYSKGGEVFQKYDLNTSFLHAASVGQTVFFGTDNGLRKYDPATDNIAGFVPDPIISSLNKTSITLMLALNSRLIIGTETAGLFVIDIDGQPAVQQYIQGSHITDIFTDHKGELWINTFNNEIYRYSPESKSIKRYEFDFLEQSFLVTVERQIFFEDSRNDLWINLQWGLAYYNRVTDTFEIYKHNPNDPSSISSKMITCIMEDKSGLLWLGTGKPNGGVNKIIMRHPSFKQIYTEQRFVRTENTVRAIFRDSNNKIWTGIKSGKLLINDPEDFTKDKNPVQVNLNTGYGIYTITEDQEGHIWIGTKGGGIFVSKETIKKKDFYKNPQFYKYNHTPGDSAGLSSNIIYSIFQDSRKRIWIGSFGAGLLLVKKRTPGKIYCQAFNTSNSSITSNKVRNVFEDSQNRLWIATTFGLNILIEDSSGEYHFQSFFSNQDDHTTLTYNDIIHIFEDSHNRLWFCTFGGGINRLVSYSGSASTAIFEHYDQKNGLINNAVYCILEDNLGFLWISTEEGISRFDYNTKDFENFDKNSGLLVNSFSESTGAILPNNELLFGNTQGTLLINPDKLEKNLFKPNLVLTNFQIFNKDVDHRQPDSPIRQTIETLSEIELDHLQSSFSIEFAALNYNAFSKNKYRYMLENFDKDWNEVGNLRKATYTNLKPGKYTFKVEGASWDGSWTENPRTLQIIINPPWWKTKTAYFIYFLITAIILEVIRKYYVRYMRLQNDLTVEKRVNDIKLRFFTNISHEIRTPLTLILGPIDDIKREENLPEEVQHKLLIMERNGKRMLRLVNQLLDFRKVQKNKMKLIAQEIELVSFLKEQILSFEQLIKQKNIRFQFECNAPFINIWADGKQFDSVIFNLLSNALKFTKEGKKISVKVDDSSTEYVDISIEDEGPGIEEEKKHLLFKRFTSLAVPHGQVDSSGIGLQLAYEIMKLHKGDILVESAPGKGSKFTVRLLRGNEHFSQISSEPLLPHKIDCVDLEENNEIVLQAANEEKENKPNILIVEDNKEIVNYLSHSLAKDYHLNYADNGVEALKLLKTFQPELIISDVMMPEMDGIEMTRAIKQSFDYSHIPVIMLTAKSSLEDQIIGIDSGAEAYILKPFNIKYLRSVINNLIKQRNTIFNKYFREGDGTTSENSKLNPEISVSITSKDEEFLKSIVSIIENNYKDPDFNVEKLVEHTAVSRTVFYNKIKGLTGLSPNEFLRKMKLKIAGKLLLEPGYNVTEVAFITGYNNVKYFRKHFKEMYGINPLDYKKMHEIDPEIPSDVAV